MRKRISVLLAILFVLLMTVPAFAVPQQDSSLPVIYIAGRGFELTRPDGTQIWAPQESALNNVIADLDALLASYMSGAFKHNFEEFNDQLYRCIVPVYEDTALGKNGMPTDGSGVRDENNWRLGLERITTTLRTSDGDYPVFRWQYDWRLSPITLAEELRDLIDAVLTKTGAPQVNIISRCEGSTITYTYLYKYVQENKVHACVLNSDITEGTDFLSAVFTGDISINPTALYHFIRFYADSTDLTLKNPETTEMLLNLAGFCESVGALRFVTNDLERIVRNVRNEVIPRVVKTSFATFPAYWSMVSADAYEKAKAFIFADDAEEYADLIALTDAYYEMQKNCIPFLRSLCGKVNVCVISKYGLPAMPLSEQALEESDLYLAVRLSSHGAIAANYGETLSDKYIRGRIEAGYDKYISPDRKIDASVCALPDTTWFIKDISHKCFPACVEDLALRFVNTDGMTVETDEAFPQFLQFDATDGGLNDAQGVLTAVKQTDKGSAFAENSFLKKITNPFIRFFKLIQSLIRLLKSKVSDRG